MRAVACSRASSIGDFSLVPEFWASCAKDEQFRIANTPAKKKPPPPPLEDEIFVLPLPARGQACLEVQLQSASEAVLAEMLRPSEKAVRAFSRCRGLLYVAMYGWGHRKSVDLYMYVSCSHWV